jgi:hypothetical protein
MGCAQQLTLTVGSILSKYSVCDFTVTWRMRHIALIFILLTVHIYVLIYGTNINTKFYGLWEICEKRLLRQYMSVCQYRTTTRLMERILSNLILSIFLKICTESTNFIKIWEEWVHYMKTDVYLLQYITEFYLE